MCIRDRNNGAGQYNAGYQNNGAGQYNTGYQNNGGQTPPPYRVEKLKDDRGPVSYTHLDVYKRQLHGEIYIHATSLWAMRTSLWVMSCLLYTSPIV